MNPNPIKPRKFLQSGDFSIRRSGAWVSTMLTEEEAWKEFLFECRGGGFVELLRGQIVVASLKGMPRYEQQQN